MMQAIESGTRTTTGVPGPDYWQQEADYALTATLLPDEKRLEGTARITYTNNAPDALPGLFLELAQNVHAEGAMRNEVMEVTGGVELQDVRVGGQTLEEVPTSELGSVPEGYGVESTSLIIKLPQPLATGAETVVEVDWAFTIPQAGASGRMGYSGTTSSSSPTGTRKWPSTTTSRGGTPTPSWAAPSSTPTTATTR